MKFTLVLLKNYDCVRDEYKIQKALNIKMDDCTLCSFSTETTEKDEIFNSYVDEQVLLNFKQMLNSVTVNNNLSVNVLTHVKKQLFEGESDGKKTSS